MLIRVDSPIGPYLIPRKAARRRLLNEQDGRCAYCNDPMTMTTGRQDTVTLDHATPTARGGRTEMSNLVGACSRCNNLKGDMTVDEFRAGADPAAARRAYNFRKANGYG